jgi:hypothetical protein
VNPPVLFRHSILRIDRYTETSDKSILNITRTQKSVKNYLGRYFEKRSSLEIEVLTATAMNIATFRDILACRP